MAKSKRRCNSDPLLIDLNAFKRPPMGVTIGDETFALIPNTLENFKGAAERQKKIAESEDLAKVYDLTVDLMSFICPEAGPDILGRLEGPQIKVLIDAWTNQTVEAVMADEAEAVAIASDPTSPG